MNIPHRNQPYEEVLYLYFFFVFPNWITVWPRNHNNTPGLIPNPVTQDRSWSNKRYTANVEPRRAISHEKIIHRVRVERVCVYVCEKHDQSFVCFNALPLYLYSSSAKKKTQILLQGLDGVASGASGNSIRPYKSINKFSRQGSSYSCAAL